MAFSYKATRLSAFAQVLIGSLLATFGIVERAVVFIRHSIESVAVFPVWMGIWICVTGVIGIRASRRNDTINKRMICVYMGFSITSTVFAGILAFGYGPDIASYHHSCNHFGIDYAHVQNSTHYEHGNHANSTHVLRGHYSSFCNTKIAMSSLILILALVEFVVGIWASVCCCRGNNCCNCCAPPMAPGQVVYYTTPQGPVTCYIATTGPDGVPIAMATQAGGPTTVSNGTPQPMQVVNVLTVPQVVGAQEQTACQSYHRAQEDEVKAPLM